MPRAPYVYANISPLTVVKLQRNQLYDSILNYILTVLIHKIITTACAGLPITQDVVRDKTLVIVVVVNT